MIVGEQLTVTLGRRDVVTDVSLAVAAGEVVALIGPNGAGKSTLLHALAGDRRLRRGRVRLGDRDVRTLSIVERARRRAVLSQRAALTAGFTALEVAMLGRDHGTHGERAAAAHASLAAVGLAHLAGRAYPTLSGGEQQRVQLARVLVQLGDGRDRALFLDEPTAALDPRFQHRALALARAAAAAGAAVVVVLHDLTLALTHADRVALLDGGRLVACTSPAALSAAHLRQAFGVDFDLVPTAAGAVAAIARPPRPSPLESDRDTYPSLPPAVADLGRARRVRE